MRSLVRGAFLQVCAGYSPDRVVADPDLNRMFLSECRRQGLTPSARDLNRSLLNLRKASNLTGLKSRRTVFPHQDEYIFASEIAIRFLERRDGATLDEVICDPGLAAEFDEIAARIAPGYSPLQYRWAALSLHKSRRLPPEPLGHALAPMEVRQFTVDGLTPEAIPESQGLYLFLSRNTCLYIGEAANLRKRIRKHLDFSDNRGLAHWFWQHGTSGLLLEIQLLDPLTSRRARKAMELELIRSRQPTFNVCGT